MKENKNFSNLLLSDYQKIKPKIYLKLIKTIKGNSYRFVRLRIALCLLTLFGIPINSLRYLKVEEIRQLMKSSSICLDYSKQKLCNHSIFLTKEGKNLLKARKKDFDYIFLMRNPDSYIFTTDRNYDQPLSRETITKDINKILRSVSNYLPDHLTIKSYSFRSGYISDLWENAEDIKLVQQFLTIQIFSRSLSSKSYTKK